MDKANKNSPVRAGAAKAGGKSSPEFQEALAREVADLKDKIAAAAAAIAAHGARQAPKPETTASPVSLKPAPSAAPAVVPPEAAAASAEDAFTAHADALDERLNEVLEAIVSDVKSFMDASLQGIAACAARIAAIEEKLEAFSSGVRDSGAGAQINGQEPAAANPAVAEGGRRERSAALWYSRLMAKGMLGENYSELIVTVSPLVVNGQSVDHWSYFVHYYENELSISLRKNDLPEGVLEKWPSEDKWGPVFRLPWAGVVQCGPDVLEKAGLTPSDARGMAPRIAALPKLTKEALAKVDARTQDFWAPLIGGSA